MINKGIKDNMDRQIQNIKYKSIIIAVLSLLFPYSIYAKVKTRHILNRIQRYYESNSKFYTDIIDLNSYVKYQKLGIPYPLEGLQDTTPELAKQAKAHILSGIRLRRAKQS